MVAKEVSGLNGNDMHVLLDELAVPKQTYQDMTITEAAGYWGVSWSTAKRRMQKLVDSGKVEKIWGSQYSGRRSWLYRPVKGE